MYSCAKNNTSDTRYFFHIRINLWNKFRINRNPKIPTITPNRPNKTRNIPNRKISTTSKNIQKTPLNITKRFKNFTSTYTNETPQDIEDVHDVLHIRTRVNGRDKRARTRSIYAIFQQNPQKIYRSHPIQRCQHQNFKDPNYSKAKSAKIHKTRPRNRNAATRLKGRRKTEKAALRASSNFPLIFHRLIIESSASQTYIRALRFARQIDRAKSACKLPRPFA